MKALALVAGADDAASRVARMVERLAAYGGPSGVRELAPDMAVGWVAYPWQTAIGLTPSTNRGAETLVAVIGEIFDADGPTRDPAASIREAHERDELDRLGHLNGSFAAAIVDPRRGLIVLATDRVGARPLFVWHNGEGLAVASRLDALLADDRVPRRLSFQGLSELLCYQRTVFDQTQYADVQAMPAAELWTFADGRLSRRQTRRLAWRRPDFDEREGATRLADALTRAARRRTAGPGRCGLLMSGGLDSRVVLAASRAVGRVLPCVTAGAFDNQEVGLARASAERAGAPFRFIENPPEGLAAGLEPATAACDGLFSSPLNLFRLWPEIAGTYDILLSGHGLDYTIRGYYLPCTMVRVAGSTTRLPRLRRIPDGSPATVARSLRVGISGDSVRRVLRPGPAAEWEARTVDAMGRALSAADIEDPYDAWDAFILHALGRHYAYSDFVAMENYAPHRTLTYDSEVLDIYLAMPPAWRASGRMAHRAMCRLGPDLMALPDANSGFAAKHSFWTQIALIYLRAAARRAGLARRPRAPDPTMTQGSWPDYAELYRREPAFRMRLERLAAEPALMDTGLFDGAGLARLVEDHMNRKANHKKLLGELLTISSWLARHGHAVVAFDR